MAMSYGNVYVAQIAMGANAAQTLQARSARRRRTGPSLVIAYSHCIAHGIECRRRMHSRSGGGVGYWPLYRFDPRRAQGQESASTGQRRPHRAVRGVRAPEGRFTSLEHAEPERARLFLELAQRHIDERRRRYERMAGNEGATIGADARASSRSSEGGAGGAGDALPRRRTP